MTVGGNATTATFAGLANGTPYTFTVVATNEEGNSPASAPSNPVTPAGPPFADDDHPTAVPDVGRVYVEWAAANPNGSPIVRYELSVNGGAWENVGNVLSTTRGGLANSTNYTFQVRAVNDVERGCRRRTPPRAQTPGPPSQVGGLSLNPGNAQISASWSQPPENGKPITSYHLDIDPGGDPSSSDRSYVFGGLNNGQQYGIRVQACNAVGCGAWSGFQYATPRAPVNVNWSKGASAQGAARTAARRTAAGSTSAAAASPPAHLLDPVLQQRPAARSASPNNATANGNGDLSRRQRLLLRLPQRRPSGCGSSPGGHESEHRTFGN